MPRDDAQRRLESAIKAAGYRCVECGSNRVSVELCALLGPIPVIHHWRVSPWDWCACTWGGKAAERATLDLLEALAAVLAPVSHFGEPVWHRRELVSALCRPQSRDIARPA